MIFRPQIEMTEPANGFPVVKQFEKIRNHKENDQTWPENYLLDAVYALYFVYMRTENQK